MTMILVATIPQVDGGIRYLLDSDRAAAGANIRAIQESGVLDAADPAYIVDAYPSCPLRAERSPNPTMSPAEWAAVSKAIR